MTKIQGEKVRFAVPDSAYAEVRLVVGTVQCAMAKSGVEWSCVVDTSNLAGRSRWAIFADGTAVDDGELVVRPLVSKYAAVVAAIDEAMRGNAVNGKYSVSVGEISISDKSFDEMAKFRAYYQGLADAEEAGASAGPQFTHGEYYGAL